MKEKLTKADLDVSALEAGLTVREDYGGGGYRITRDGVEEFPGALEPAESKKACAGFILGVLAQKRYASHRPETTEAR